MKKPNASTSTTRMQEPGVDSSTTELRQDMRDIRSDLMPYMTYEEIGSGEDGKESKTHYRVKIGKSRSIGGSIWKGGGYFRVNFVVPFWAKDALPEKDEQRIVVFRGSTSKTAKDEDENGSDESSTYEVRAKIQDKADFLKFVRPFLAKLVEATKNTGGEEETKTEAFDLVGVHIAEDYRGFQDAVPMGFDFFGEGKGSYLAVRTSKCDARQVIELIGPLPTMVESVDVRKGWEPVLHVEAENREHGLEKTVQYFRKKGLRVDESFGTLKVEAAKKSSVSEEEIRKYLRIATEKVVNCTEMNLDDLEDDTQKVIKKAQRLVQADSTSARDLYMILKDLMNTSEMNSEDMDETSVEAAETAQDALLTYKNNARKSVRESAGSDYDAWQKKALVEFNEKFGKTFGKRKYYETGDDRDPDDVVEFSENGDAYPHSKGGGTNHVKKAVTPYKA